jgi:hypothetical protein
MFIISPSLLLHSILILNLSNHYPLRVTGELSAVQELVQIMNDEALAGSPVEARLLSAETNEYGIHLIKKLDDPGYAKRQNRFQCALNYLLGDSSKTFNIRLVQNDHSILIGDGRKGIIDIADAQKFGSEPGGDFTAFNILLHELYEQYQLQVVDQLRPGKITPAQLTRAHLKAIQKESNFYSVMEVRTQAHVGDAYIDIEFTSRIDASKTHYYAYHSNGNIDRVERYPQ